MTITNANPAEVTAEISIGSPGATGIVAQDAALATVDGIPTWFVGILSNSSDSLTPSIWMAGAAVAWSQPFEIDPIHADHLHRRIFGAQSIGE